MAGISTSGRLARRLTIAGACLAAAVASHAQTISGTTYALTTSTGASLEDMSTGTTYSGGPASDDTASGLVPIGFTFWFDGDPYTAVSTCANGWFRLGAIPVDVTTAGSTSFNNSSATDGAFGGSAPVNYPKIMPYYDDINTGNNGKVHFKQSSSPSRHLTIEWTGMVIPRNATAPIGAGAATFQASIWEDGHIDFVYGSGLVGDASNGGASIGLHDFDGVSSYFASLDVTTGGSPAAPATNYTGGTAFNANTVAIPSGTKYTFTPLAVSAPTAFSITTGATPGLSQTLNWTNSASSGSIGTALYRSDDGNNYFYYASVLGAPSAANSVNITGLGNSSTYFWKLGAISEGSISSFAAASAQTGTTGGTPVAAGTYAIPGGFADLATAFSSITTNGMAGNVVLELTASQTSATGFTVPACAGPQATLTVRPAAGSSGISISSSGTTVANYPALTLNGASFVTIDGREGGTGSTRSLTVENTAASAAVDTGAILIQNDSANTTVKYCTVKGNNTAGASNLGGAIVVGGTTGLVGNDNVTIDNCDVTAQTVGNLRHGIVVGSASVPFAPSRFNDGVTVSNNLVHDFFTSTSTSQRGIYVFFVNSGTRITGNKIYQTAARTYVPAAAQTVSAILLLQATAGFPSGYGFTISNNRIGYADEAGTAGTFTTLNGTAAAIATSCRGIDITSFGTTTVSGNTITNLQVSNTGTAVGSILAFFPAAGDVTLTNNTLGSVGSDVDLVSYTGAAAPGASVNLTGIQTQATRCSISGNSLGALTAKNSVSTNGATVRVIGLIATSYAELLNNTIGGTAAHSIRASTSLASGGTGITNTNAIRGSNNTSIPLNLIRGNTVQNISATGAGATGQCTGYLGTNGFNFVDNNTFDTVTSFGDITGVGSFASACAIAHSVSATTGHNGQQITRNTVKNVVANPTTAATAVTASGIYVRTHNTATSGSPNLVSRNLVYGLTSNSTGAAELTGIDLGSSSTATDSGVCTVMNNMVDLGNSITTGTARITGILENNGTRAASIYANSVYIGGAPTTGSANSFAMRRAKTPTSDTTDIRDNMFVNERSNSGSTGKHYAIATNATTQVASTSNGFYGTGSGFVFGLFNAADEADQTAWNGATGFDASPASQTINPTFSAPTAATPDLHVPCASPVAGLGVTIASVAEDFDSTARPASPAFGADEAGPVVKTKNFTVALNSGGAASIVATDVDNGSADVCGGTGLAVSPSAFGCSNVGSNTVTLTVTGTSGKTATGTATVTVVDSTLPTINTCASTSTGPVDSNCVGHVPDLASSVSASDNCTVASIVQSPAANTVVALGSTTAVNITVTDSSGNVATCSANYTAADQTAPSISVCTPGSGATADGSCQAAVPDYTGGVSASDNCTLSGSLSITQSPTAGTMVGLGNNAVTISVKDAALNEATCPVTFAVTDGTAPTSAATSPSGTLTQANPIFNVAFSSSDNCAGTVTTHLWWRLNGSRAFAEYGSGFTTSPIAFDSSTTGGDGVYEFYTIAVDAATNAETDPGAADVTVTFNDTTSVNDWTTLDGR